MGASTGTGKGAGKGAGAVRRRRSTYEIMHAHAEKKTTSAEHTIISMMYSRWLSRFIENITLDITTQIHDITIPYIYVHADAIFQHP